MLVSERKLGSLMLGVGEVSAGKDIYRENSYLRKLTQLFKKSPRKVIKNSQEHFHRNM